LIDSNRPGHTFDFCGKLGWCAPLGPPTAEVPNGTSFSSLNF
jgi:hypothetical protein